MQARPRIAAAIALASSALLGGCGGGDKEDQAAEPTWTPSAALEAPAPALSPSQMQARRLTYIPDTPQAVAQRAAATAEEAQLIVQDEHGDSPRSFTLAPEFGKGYAPLRLTMVARRIGDTAAAAPVRPACSSNTRCEYRLQGTYQVQVDDPDVQLTARDDVLALSVRTLQVDKTRTVAIRFLREGQLSSVREVVLLRDPPSAIAAASPAPGSTAPAAIGTVKRLAYLK